jgi:molybdenum cofactor biosynthesis protein B
LKGGSPTTETHRAEGGGAYGFALLTVSDTRVPSTDTSGAAMRELVEAAGHRVHAMAIVPDEPERVRAAVLAWTGEPGCDVIVTSGGTGLSARDRTVEALVASFDARIEGFGELFRMLSYREIGSAAILTRATAGVIAGRPVFLLPGSPHAVRLALSSLVLPEIGHVLRELRRQGSR